MSQGSRACAYGPWKRRTNACGPARPSSLIWPEIVFSLEDG
jgi:hypothetical protein